MLTNTLSKENRDNLGKRLATYTAAATVATTVIAEDADAGVVYQDIPDVVISEPSPGIGVVAGFDLDNNGTIDFEFGHQLISASYGAGLVAAGENLTAVSATTNTVAATSTTYNGDTFFYLQNLSIGTIVDSSLTAMSSLGSLNRGYLAYGVTSSCGNCEFTADANGLLGVSFDADGQTNYGWMRVKVDEGPINRITVMSYAYEDTGAPIAAGTESVPEPGCLGLLAFGGAGLLAWRRRRNQPTA